MENCLDTFRSYIHEFGEKLKIENLDLDDHHDCYMAFDEKFFVKCSINPEKEQIILLAYIGSLPADQTVYYRELLVSNYFWNDTAGSNLSLDPSDGTLILTQYCDMNMLNYELFHDVLEKFVNAMEHWDTKRLAEWSASKEEDLADAPSMAMMGPGTPNMMMFGA
ncbi:MAG: type III secretion system chaperone [Puniceicoccales bacterium]|jgi:hypothetical protein|nr:type III secretion system chaperone [Puniceicoccales bacterium]